jgi:hypothetical protein
VDGPGHRPLRSRDHPHLPCLPAECSAVIDAKAALRLPLVHHFVQHRVLDLGPGMPGQVPPADCDLQRLAGPNLNRQLTQPGPHAAGQPDWDLPQRSSEVFGI